MAGRSDEAQGWSETHQHTLKGLLDVQIERLKNTTDLAVVAEVEKITKGYTTVARAVKAVDTMVPEPKAKPATQAADDDEAPMHDGIPDDPEELHDALAERFAYVADLIEQKRRAALDGVGETGSPARDERDAGEAPGPSAEPGP